LEPEHGEGWANLAALWLQAGQWQQALSASEQAVKHKRESWQAWENYSQAALRAGSLLLAARGVQQVLALSDGHRVAMPLLVGLVEGLERQAAARKLGGAAQHQQQNGNGKPQEEEASSKAEAADAAAAAGGTSDDSEGELMEAPTELLGLLDLTQSLPGAPPSQPSPLDGTAAADAAAAADRALSQVVAATGAVLKSVTGSPSCSADAWGLLGRWYALQEQPLPAKEALLKQVRALQGGPYGRERAAFEAMGEASLHMADAYLRLAAGGQGGVRDLAAARMHLRGVLRQTEAEFGGSELHEQLEGKLREVEGREAAAKAAAAAAAAAALPA